MKFLKRLKSTLSSVAERTSCRVFVAKNSSHRKVLIVADEPSINNLLALVRKLDSRRLVSGSSGTPIQGIDRRSFDTAILDLRCSPGRPASRGYGFGEVWPNMVGKVLVINAEVNNLKTLQLAERYIYQRHSLDGLLLEITGRARSLVDRAPSPSRV